MSVFIVSLEWHFLYLHTERVQIGKATEDKEEEKRKQFENWRLYLLFSMEKQESGNV